MSISILDEADLTDPYYYAQNMLEGLESDVEEIRNPGPADGGKRKSKPTRKRTAKESTLKSYVVSKAVKRGHRLVKIEVFDLNECQDTNSENAVLSAQYVVVDPVDEVMDMAENIVNKISKKMCNNY
ncbi:hypothetical protein JYU34_017045 [Plutella xylostella]|uniref:Uncharacterized protein n=1 Tax=Plutella xylostella TaxID=51655 RepID=A0ABQ7Q4F0_PLUXY|nr:uncharacterized protein LOC119693395 [Plutella xylostella]XP_037973901.2 uncharacterized protein LOC105396176 [Plutella xylostella]KAG7294795.1 hypothetical protein JYU34_022837 [Plutella xylostella]KAG7299575.1 hypothetical protein JYU34_016556 [Plutella xylostella]KAG7299656.1 hypothetical protein JYU34_016646 [Plutella xylostella]KAG7300005.1 hypothetical protein JYU34_017045 [Plutella xylostella]